jgi:RNA polymerase sigma-70 factor (ECF subfamily)
MRRLAEGDNAALGELYLRYGGMVAYAAIAAVPSLSRHDVEDVCQDVFIAVSTAAEQYREEGKLRSWIYSIAVRVARKRRRSRLLHRRLLDTVLGRPVGISGPQSMPEAMTMSRIDLNRVFQELTEIQRQILVMFELHGMSGEEVAGILGIKLNTVWSHLRRARNRILDEFDGSGRG